MWNSLRSRAIIEILQSVNLTTKNRKKDETNNFGATRVLDIHLTSLVHIYTIIIQQLQILDSYVASMYIYLSIQSTNTTPRQHINSNSATPSPLEQFQTRNIHFCIDRLCCFIMTNSSFTSVR